MIVAAEASSALYAQRILEYWKSKNFDVKAFGVGTQAMEVLGFERVGKAEEMAVVGIAEVIEHYGHLKSVFNSLIEKVNAERPNVILLLDYPDFNLRLAKKIKHLGIPIVYYISPQVWAWRKSRVFQIKELCDQVNVIFPFEEKFYSENGVKCSFVGHPLLDEVDSRFLDPEKRNLQRLKYGIQKDEILVGFMPGSRKSELKLHLDTQIEVAKKLYKLGNVKILFLCAPTIDKSYLQEALGDLRLPYMILKQEPFEMIHLTDMILAASGTATLQVALLRKPMVVMYKMKTLTYCLAKLIVHGVKFFCIVNLIFDREVVPELWQHRANVDDMFGLLKELIENKEKRNSVISDLEKLPELLGTPGATARVCKNLEAYFK